MMKHIFCGVVPIKNKRKNAADNLPLRTVTLAVNGRIFKQEPFGARHGKEIYTFRILYPLFLYHEPPFLEEYEREAAAFFLYAHIQILERKVSLERFYVTAAFICSRSSAFRFFVLKVAC